jgi:hypothetical protein
MTSQNRDQLPDGVREYYRPEFATGDPRPPMIRYRVPYQGRIEIFEGEKTDIWLWDVQTKQWLQVG